MKKLFLLNGMFLLFVSCVQVNNGKESVMTVDTIERNDTISEVEENGNETAKRLSIFKKDGKELYIERDTSWISYCYSVENGVERKMVFDQIYLDDGVAELTYYPYDKYLYIVGDIKPNSNGWTCRYLLYRIDTADFSLKYIYAGAAIRFSPQEIVVADARLTNPDADCTADEIWGMHDVHFDVNGNKIREDKKEYDYEDMERHYGNKLVNTYGLDMVNNDDIHESTNNK